MKFEKLAINSLSIIASSLLIAVVGCGESKQAKIKNESAPKSSPDSSADATKDKPCLSNTDDCNENLSTGDYEGDGYEPGKKTDSESAPDQKTDLALKLGNGTTIEATMNCIKKGLFFDRYQAAKAGDDALRDGALSEDINKWPGCNQKVKIAIPHDVCADKAKILKMVLPKGKAPVGKAYDQLLTKQTEVAEWKIDQCVWCPKGNEATICKVFGIGEADQKISTVPQDDFVVFTAAFSAGGDAAVQKINIPAAYFNEDGLAEIDSIVNP